jgi:hypothetical protein
VEDGRCLTKSGLVVRASGHGRVTVNQLADAGGTRKGYPGAGRMIVSKWLAGQESAVDHLPMISSSIRSRASSSFSGVS